MTTKHDNSTSDWNEAIEVAVKLLRSIAMQSSMSEDERTALLVAKDEVYALRRPPSHPPTNPKGVETQ